MIKNDWNDILKDYLLSDEFLILLKNIKELYKTKTIYPAYKDIFNALNLTPYKNVKVVIVGQDPYHGYNEAHGLAFSTLSNKIPPSLRNIFKELKNDLGIDNNNYNLSSWAKEGVLLLNCTLTVEENIPNSHKDLGWNNLTDLVLKKLNEKETPVVFLLWGNFAKEKRRLITSNKHLILESAHPSPFSARNFFNNNHFSKTNKYLKETNQKEINFKT